jgi:hypothetical protein
MPIKEIFEDEQGGLSYMRVASAISLIQAIATTWYGWVLGKTALEILTLTSIWIVAAFVPKALQKIVEVKGMAGLYIQNKEDKPKEETK